MIHITRKKIIIFNIKLIVLYPDQIIMQFVIKNAIGAIIPAHFNLKGRSRSGSFFLNIIKIIGPKPNDNNITLVT